jgi:hypothetical protein
MDAMTTSAWLMIARGDSKVMKLSREKRLVPTTGKGGFSAVRLKPRTEYARSTLK